MSTTETDLSLGVLVNTIQKIMAGKILQHRPTIVKPTYTLSSLLLYHHINVQMILEDIIDHQEGTDSNLVGKCALKRFNAESYLQNILLQKRKWQIKLVTQKYLQLIVIPSSTPLFLGSFTWKVPLLGMTDSVEQVDQLKRARSNQRVIGWVALSACTKIPNMCKGKYSSVAQSLRWHWKKVFDKRPLT